MTIKDHFTPFNNVAGYLGCGVFSPQGKMLGGTMEISGIHFETAGKMVHDLLLNAQKIAESSGFGRSDMIQVHTELGIIIAKCYKDDRTHFHTILVINKDGNVAMAKINLLKVVDLLKSEF